jgi:hypothetical protein
MEGKNLEAKYIYTKEFRLPSEAHSNTLHRDNQRRSFINIKILVLLIITCILCIQMCENAEARDIERHLILYEDSGSVQSLYNDKFTSIYREIGDEEIYSVYWFNLIKIKELHVERIKRYNVIPSGKPLYFSSLYKEEGISQASWGGGTLSFVVENGSFASIGHYMNLKIDESTSTSVYEGKITGIEPCSKENNYFGSRSSEIADYDDEKLGIAYVNDDTGVYGIFKRNLIGQSIPVALRSEVTEGKAQLITTLEETDPVIYDVNVKFEGPSGENYTDKFVITILDDEFYKITNGIVKGMSGSPIIQNGKVIGALAQTHNKGQNAICIFADMMLRDLQKMENKYSKTLD